MPVHYSPKRVALSVFILAYMALSSWYFYHDEDADTGLSGWLSAWQLTHFGTANRGLNSLCLLVLWLLSAVPALYLAGRLNWAERAVFNREEALADAWSPQVRRILAGMLAITTLGTFGYLSYRDAPAVARPVQSLNLLQTSPPPLAPGTERARIRGTLATQHAYLLEEKRSYGRFRTLYAPLLPRFWQASQPVRYLVKTATLTYPYEGADHAMALDSGRAFTAIYEGKLTANSLPTYVVQYYAQQHLTLASPYYVLDAREARQIARPRGFGGLNRWQVLGLGLLLAVGVLVASKPKHVR